MFNHELELLFEQLFWQQLFFDCDDECQTEHVKHARSLYGGGLNGSLRGISFYLSIMFKASEISKQPDLFSSQSVGDRRRLRSKKKAEIIET
jgi:hypothetical protein